MTTDVPTPPGEPDPSSGRTARTPRKRFLILGTGIGLAVVLLVGIFTSIGAHNTSGDSGGTSVAPRQGGPAPSFSADNISGVGPATVGLRAGRSRAPTVLLFFGAWCDACHEELPPLAAAVRSQDAAGGPLSHVKVIGVDSLDKTSAAQNFIRTAGVAFPVASDPNDTITSGDFWFTGDPYAVFVDADGTINRIVRGDVLTPSSFSADERALLHTAHTST